MRLILVALLLTVLASLQSATAAPHEYYDDGGNIQWRYKPFEAFQEGKSTGKPIFVHLCKDNHPASEREVKTTLSDPELGKLVNRYMIPVVIDASSPPPELQRVMDLRNVFKGFLDDRELNSLPKIVLLTPQGQTIISLSGLTADRYEKGFKNTLEERFPLAKAKVPMLLKTFDTLEKNLEDKKNWSKAAAAYKTIVTTPGYGDVKTRAFEAMDKAQLEASLELRQAYDHAKSDGYAEAKKLVAKVQTEYKGLPIEADAKEHASALKLLEAAQAAAADTKLNRKAEAVRQLNKLLTDHSDTPYASLAITRKKELSPPPKGK